MNGIWKFLESGDFITAKLMIIVGAVLIILGAYRIIKRNKKRSFTNSVLMFIGGYILLQASVMATCPVTTQVGYRKRSQIVAATQDYAVDTAGNRYAYKPSAEGIDIYKQLLATQESQDMYNVNVRAQVLKSGNTKYYITGLSNSNGTP